MEILKATNLIKNYGVVQAVKGISFSVCAGEIVGLLGPNGAGKTTTIQMLLGLLEPTGGRIEILGKSLKHHRYEVLKEMNFSATYAWLPGNLSIRENLQVFAMLYGVPHVSKRVEELMGIFELKHLGKSRTGVLSSGEQSRVSLAKAFVNNPKMLLLDEPTASLDPDAAERMRSLIKDLAEKNNTAILWTSHNMHEVETVCDRIIFMSHGKILAEGTPRELIVRFGKENLEETFIAIAREPLNGEL